MLQNAVKVTPDQDEDADFQKNPSSRRVNSADIECHNGSACGDEDSPALNTVRVVKCDEPDFEKSESRKQQFAKRFMYSLSILSISWERVFSPPPADSVSLLIPDWPIF